MMDLFLRANKIFFFSLVNVTEASSCHLLSKLTAFFVLKDYNMGSVFVFGENGTEKKK